MSLLCGFMFGALRKLWPFQHDLTPHIESVKEKSFAVYWPQEVNGRVLLVCGVAVAAAVFVFAVDGFTRRAKSPADD